MPQRAIDKEGALLVPGERQLGFAWRSEAGWLANGRALLLGLLWLELLGMLQIQQIVMR